MIGLKAPDYSLNTCAGFFSKVSDFVNISKTFTMYSCCMRVCDCTVGSVTGARCLSSLPCVCVRACVCVCMCVPVTV